MKDIKIIRSEVLVERKIDKLHRVVIPSIYFKRLDLKEGQYVNMVLYDKGILLMPCKE